MATKKNATFMTPPGMVKLTFLNKPSKPYTEGDKPQYKCRFLWEDNDTTRAWVDDVIAKGRTDAKATGTKLKKALNPGFKFPEDMDEDDFEIQEDKDRPKYDEDYRGKIWLEVKSAYPPGLIDAARQTLPETVIILPGDVCRAKLRYNPYEGFGSGLSYYPVTIQLLEKNATLSSGPDTDGFDDEDGYVAGGNQTDDEEEEDDEIPF